MHPGRGCIPDDGPLMDHAVHVRVHFGFMMKLSSNAKSQLKSMFSDDEGDKEYEQTMDYREMMKNQANQAIDENFGDELVIPLPEVSERLLGHF